MNGPVRLVCPNCRGELETLADGVRCVACGARFPLDEAGCPAFREPDPFYETEPVHWDHAGPRLILPFVDAGITDFLARHLPAEGPILDVGCGAGLRFLAERPQVVVGVDASPKRLAAARRIYDAAYLADLARLPFPDESFAAVVSVDVLEHVPLEAKDAVLAEWTRVLRRGGEGGGRHLHVLDLDARKPLYRLARRLDPDLWRAYFVERMGHHGLETATEAEARFARLGLRRVAAEATNRTFLQHPENYAWQFDPGFCAKSKWIRALTRASYFLRRSRIRRFAYGVFYAAWIRTLERLFPRDWAFNLAVCYERVDAESPRE